jgi:hypothetical protein
MALVDAVALEDGSGGLELGAPVRSRRHALVVFVYVTGVTAIQFRKAWRANALMVDPLSMALPLFFFLVAAFAWTVRRGRLRIEPEGVRWGFNLLGFRMRAARIASLKVYQDGVGLLARGARVPWFLAARDWDRWPEALAAFARLGQEIKAPLEQVPGRAPLRVRAQAYGLALDVILIIDSVLATLFLIGA